MYMCYLCNALSNHFYYFDLYRNLYSTYLSSNIVIVYTDLQLKCSVLYCA